MNKLALMVAIATALSLIACGESEQEKQERQIQVQQQQINDLNTKNAELARKLAVAKGEVDDDESKVNTDKSMYDNLYGK